MLFDRFMERFLFPLVNSLKRRFAMKQNQDTLRVHHVNIKELNPAPYNPRRWSESAIEQLKEISEDSEWSTPCSSITLKGVKMLLSEDIFGSR